MTDLRTTDLALAVQRALEAMPVLEQKLNAADAKLGDGDTGGMLARVIEALATGPTCDGDLGVCFTAYAKAAAGATGSSLGTLLATALLTMAGMVKGRGSVPLDEFGPLLRAAVEAMLKRGQTALGDKTVIDALDAVSHAVAGKATWDAIGPAAVEAAQAALENFRDQPCRIGRARMFGDKSRGLDDPGMLAFVGLTMAIVGRLQDRGQVVEPHGPKH